MGVFIPVHLPLNTMNIKYEACNTPQVAPLAVKWAETLQQEGLLKELLEVCVPKADGGLPLTKTAEFMHFTGKLYYTDGDLGDGYYLNLKSPYPLAFKYDIQSGLIAYRANYLHYLSISPSPKSITEFSLDAKAKVYKALEKVYTFRKKVYAKLASLHEGVALLGEPHTVVQFDETDVQINETMTLVVPGDNP